MTAIPDSMTRCAVSSRTNVGRNDSTIAAVAASVPATRKKKISAKYGRNASLWRARLISHQPKHIHTSVPRMIAARRKSAKPRPYSMVNWRSTSGSAKRAGQHSVSTSRAMKVASAGCCCRPFQAEACGKLNRFIVLDRDRRWPGALMKVAQSF
ncbi:hypothetical protein OKW34_006928 [Paraburkholderia youngii]